MIKLKLQPPNFENHLALILSHQKFQETNPTVDKTNKKSLIHIYNVF